jgi:hypothetical protein
MRTRSGAISTTHFDANAGIRESARDRGRPLSEIMVAGSTFHRGHLKRRLYREGLKEPRCELCGQDEEWRGRKMALILDHINGVATDNRLENLQIVCPNCAATLDTHCGRNLPRRELEVECERCGKRYLRQRPEQRYCSRACGTRYARVPGARLATRKVERPPYEQLVREVAESSYVAVGRRYGVSDNAIRKWLRAYERELGAAPVPRAA